VFGVGKLLLSCNRRKWLVGCRLKTKLGIMLCHASGVYYNRLRGVSFSGTLARAFCARMVLGWSRQETDFPVARNLKFAQNFSNNMVRIPWHPNGGFPVGTSTYAATPSNAGGRAAGTIKIPCGIMPNGSPKASSFLCCVSCRTDRTKEQNQTYKLKEITVAIEMVA
jgi:hypothetical protein